MACHDSFCCTTYDFLVDSLGDAPRGKGGGPEPENIRHLCRPHNTYVAELEYGRAHIERAIAKRRANAQALRSGKGKEAAKPTKDNGGSGVLEDGPRGPNSSK